MTSEFEGVQFVGQQQGKLIKFGVGTLPDTDTHTHRGEGGGGRGGALHLLAMVAESVRDAEFGNIHQSRFSIPDDVVKTRRRRIAEGVGQVGGEGGGAGGGGQPT